MSRRYFISYAPFAHVNGKLAPVAIKVKNTTDPAQLVQDGFYYGYRHYQDRCRQSHFAMRTKARNLNTHPYSASETATKQLFATSQSVVCTALRDNIKRAKCEADFIKQKKYITLRGYATAAVIANGGQWLNEWT